MAPAFTIIHFMHRLLIFKSGLLYENLAITTSAVQ